MDEKMKLVQEIVKKHNNEPKQLIPILSEVQEVYRYLPEEVMEYIAIELGITGGQVYGSATFYAHFTLEPKGKYVIKVCDGTACHVKKSTDIIRAIQQDLNLTDKVHTTDDGLFTLEAVACVGACGIAPVVVVNEDVYGSVTVPKMMEIMKDYKGREENNE